MFLRKQSIWTSLLAGFTQLLVTSSLHADVTLPAIFGDHMVLQQNAKIPVWGSAEPGEEVMVTLGDRRAKTKAGTDGKWRVDLMKTAAASKPETMTVKGKNTLTFQDVLVGEVWVCSGQSNMSFSLWHVNNGQEEISNATYPKIRMFVVDPSFRPVPQENCSGRWMVCRPDVVGVQGFSAVGYFFARELHQKLHVPIGMLHSSIGGSDGELWISLAGLKKLPQFQTEIDHAEAYIRDYTSKLPGYPAEVAQYKKEFTEVAQAQLKQEAAWHAKIDAEDQGLKESWMKSPITGGLIFTLPDDYSHPSLGSYLGTVWCQKEVKIPGAWVGKSLELHLGMIDEVDDSYVNGQKVGTIWFDEPEFFSRRRVYTVPAALVTANTISVTVRMVNRFGELGFFGPENEMRLICKDSKESPVALSGVWSYRKALEWKTADIPADLPSPKEPWSKRVPGAAFNAMIHPLIPYGIRGAIWYQGENNITRATAYRELLPGLIDSWRTAWGQGNFPFYIVQLANYGTATALVEKNSEAELREAQAMTASRVPNAGLAVTLDGVAEGHPTNKAIVGQRLALQALAKTYGKDLVCDGPSYQSMKAEGDCIRISFQSAEGLQSRETPNTKSKGDQILGCSIAGEDKVFYTAQARVDGTVLVVWSEKVAKPVAVRYSWADNPIGNLYNAARLPMVPFRTDKWSPIEIGVAGEKPAPQ